MKAQRLLFCIILYVLSFTTAHAQSFDFGDAPDSYGTLLNSNGARHTPAAVGGLYLGGVFGTNGYDTESDGQPSVMADGDDTHDQNGNIISVGSNQDDETAVYDFQPVPLAKSSYSVVVNVYNNSGVEATVSAWIDFNKNGVFDPNERAQTVVPTTPNLSHYNGTLITITWSGLTGLSNGMTYARIRVALNAAEIENPTGLANSGEVEDYTVQIKDLYDFGDAPESYGTLLNADGPRHLINNNSVIIGALDPSAEDDGKPSLLADADNDNRDGYLSFPYKLTTATTTYSVHVNVTNKSTTNAMLSGWIDFNKNGVFGSSERVQAIIYPDTRNLVLTWSGLSDLTEGRTYARFRLATNASEVTKPTGFASSGEVQDYSLLIESAAMPVDITLLQGRWIEGKGNQLNWSTAWERDNDRFEIQSSRDAKSFESIGRLTGKGTTNAAQTYTFIDAQPLADLTYYRLKQVDSDGHFNYSTIISIQRGNDSMKESLLVYPNPTTALLYLQASNQQDVTDITIYTASGRRVHYQSGFSSSISVVSLPAGVYVLELKTVSGQVLRQRFVKQ